MNEIQRFFILLSLFLITKGYYESVEGLKTRSRIVSGMPVRRNQFPWQVALKKSRSGPLHGAGTIISKNWILTAAHCIHDLRFIHVLGGTIYWRNKNVMPTISRYLYPHPEFDANNYKNDIGLINVKRSFQFSPLIQPIALVTYEYSKKDLSDVRAIIIGFGHIHDRMPNPYGDLLQAPVTIISNEECDDIYPNVFETTMCSVGADSNESICDGDSGGPLIIRDPDGNPMQAGVIAFSAEVSCDDNLPSGFTRVSSYLDFISQVTNITLN